MRPERPKPLRRAACELFNVPGKIDASLKSSVSESGDIPIFVSEYPQQTFLLARTIFLSVKIESSLFKFAPSGDLGKIRD
jgi:hypothetical protein